MFKELYPSDFINLSFEKATQKIPFESTTRKAIEIMGRKIIQLKDESHFYTWSYKDKKQYLIHVTFSKGQLIVHHFLNLLPNNPKTSGQSVLVQLAKSFRMTDIILQTSTRFEVIESLLINQHYTFLPGIGYICPLNYCTGLVLGGGGAKGAYQIGVWHALDELGIKYEMISGTSVGALNGALILQGDLEAAENMWQTITTDKILSVPKIKVDYSINQLLKSWQELTTLAIQSKGVSTKPLQMLITDFMKPDKIFSNELEFYIVTTASSSMEETVVSIKEMTTENFPLWLLASSSFFPAMAPCLINGMYYIDGGYRNNVPKDVLVNKGATEIIVVDVSGPGLSKPFKVPENVVEVTLKSPWKLGSMLLFDGNRSTWNMRLGYLETMKLFGYFVGSTYTFEKKEFKKESVQLSREFFSFISKIPRFKEWYDRKSSLTIWNWLIKNDVQPETISVTILESLAKSLDVSPTEVYQLIDFSELILKKWHNKELSLTNDMLKSISEWAATFVQQKSPLADSQLMAYFYDYFKEKPNRNKELFPVLMEASWMSAFEALFILFLEERN